MIAISPCLTSATLLTLPPVSRPAMPKQTEPYFFTAGGTTNSIWLHRANPIQGPCSNWRVYRELQRALPRTSLQNGRSLSGRAMSRLRLEGDDKTGMTRSSDTFHHAEVL